jgi:ribosome-binding factor A
MKRVYDRAQRVAVLIQKELAMILHHASDDERFRLVTITSATVSRDFAYAKIYVSILLDDQSQIKEVVQSLNRSAKAFRYLLAKQVDLRVVPELKFHYDESTAYGFKLSNLIDTAIKKTDKNK